jgi:hypothetical protein
MATRHRGVDPGGARDDYEYSVKQADGSDPLHRRRTSRRQRHGGAAWTGTLPSGYEAKGLSLCRISGGLVRSTRHAFIGNLLS